MDSRELRHAALRARAVKIAYDTLQAEGEAAIQARRIADAAECSVGTLYNVFGSLDGLWLELNALTLEALHARLDDVLDDADTADALALAVKACETVLAFSQSNAAQWRGLITSPVPIENDAGGALPMHSVAHRLRKVLRQTQSNEETSEADRVADALIAMVEGLTARISAGREPQLEVDHARAIMSVAIKRAALTS